MPFLVGTAAGAGGAIGTASYTGAMLAADVALATAAVSATSQIQQGKYQQEMAEYNAALATQEAETVKEAGEYEEREARIEGRRLRAKQLLQFAKGGVVPTTGTPLIVGKKTAVDIEKDIQLQRYGYGLQYSRTLSRARLERMKGKGARRASRWAAGTSLLTGAYRASSVFA